MITITIQSHFVQHVGVLFANTSATIWAFSNQLIVLLSALTIRSIAHVTVFFVVNKFVDIATMMAHESIASF
jgi:hypothetical protein